MKVLKGKQKFIERSKFRANVVDIYLQMKKREKCLKETIVRQNYKFDLRAN